MNVATMAVACVVLALAVDVLTPGADGASPAAAVERRAAEARIDTAFVAASGSPLAGVPAVARHAQSRCGDFDVSFLNANCSTAWKKHPARLHRPATFVAGVANAGPSGPQLSTSPGQQVGSVTRPTLAAAALPDRPSAPAKKLKPAMTAGLVAATQ
jgi:hypothetical protein